MEFQEADLPFQLVYNVSRLNSKRNRVIVLPTTQQSMTSGTGVVVNFQLPDRSICCLDTATLTGQFKLTATASSVADASSNITYVYPAGSDLVAQNQLLINGGLVVSGSLDQYAHISQKMWKKLQTSEHNRNADILSRDNGTYINANVVLASGGSVFGNVVANTATEGVAKPWISYSEMPACRTSKYLDTSIFGKSYLTFRPSGIQQIKGTNLESRNAKWTWDLLELSLDILSEPPVEYVELVKSMIASNKVFRQVFYNPVSTVFGYNNNIKLNVSSACIDSIMLAPVQNNGITSFYSNASNLECPCFTFGWGANASFDSKINLNLRVGNMSIPQTGQYTYLYRLADVSKQDLFGDSIYTQNSLYVAGVQQAQPFKEFYSEAGYCNQNAIYYNSLSALLQPAWAHEKQILSGYNSMGQDVIFSLTTAPDSSITASSSTTQLFLHASTSAVAVMDSQSGSVSIVY